MQGENKVKGIITKSISNIYVVETEKNEIFECTARGKLKQDEISPVVGDKVIIEKTQLNEAVIDEILERKTYCKRPKLANLSQIIFVISLKMPKPDLLLLDKQLAFSQMLGIKSIILLNKIDLEKDEKQIETIANIYRNIGYEVLCTNAKQLDDKNKKRILKLLENNITAFSGNSGVGKSTLINAIFSTDLTQEGIISKKNKKGKNTTTAITLYKISKNTYIADTPGFSTFDISEIESVDLDKFFVEFKKEIDNCEFVGCTHIKEENCGIKKAINEGKISEQRYKNYCKIYLELKEKEQHKW